MSPRETVPTPRSKQPTQPTQPTARTARPIVSPPARRSRRRRVRVGRVPATPQPERLGASLAALVTSLQAKTSSGARTAGSLFTLAGGKDGGRERSPSSESSFSSSSPSSGHGGPGKARRRVRAMSLAEYNSLVSER